MMKIHNPSHHQPLLLEVFPDFEFKSAASARTHYGKAMEELVCAAMGLVDIPINGNCEINFDAKSGRLFYEIKSVRGLPSSKSVIYDWRIEKEKPYRKRLRYVFGLHCVKHAKSNQDLWEQLSKGVKLLSVPSAKVHRLALKEPLRKIKTERLERAGPRDGYSRKGYCEGYRNLKVASLQSGSCTEIFKLVKIYDFKIPVTIQSFRR